ncbi:MAG TPA: beta-propeller domain-containing protein [Polyangiales bacterium]|nr:beta-propeller domain-containing protein [Polyangiales bacterium]
MNNLRMARWLSTGLVLGSLGCSDGGGPTTGPSQPGKPDKTDTSPVTSDGTPTAQQPVSNVTPGDPQIPVSTVLASLSVAADCDDLLTRAQDDAIAKLMMEVERYKKQPLSTPGLPPRGGVLDAGIALPSSSGDESSGDDDSADAPGNFGSGSGKGESAPPSADPIGASETNHQVEGVDEADFVKLVDKGKSLYLLHGNTLRKLSTWPAAQTELVGQPLTIEGSPSELFVTDTGKAVAFSSVYSYASTPGKPAIADCFDCGGYGSGSLKVTIADVSTDTPKVEREIYYEGSYLSSRRYGDIVRVVIQSYSKFAGLFQPQIQWTDSWGRPYDKANIAKQLDDWQARTEDSIRNTELSDWFPVAQQVVDGKLVDIEPGCSSYFVPDPGLSDYGLTHVLSLDTSKADSEIGGITVVGAASTVYSSAAQLVLAQPDYRWSGADWGVISNQQTAYHVFNLDGANTRYTASGWLFGGLPRHNAQFGIDLGANGTLRIAATGWVRDQPAADPSSEQFWAQHTENRVLIGKIDGGKVVLAGQSEKLGKVAETIQSARFVGDRAYVVTFREIDPLIVLDVAGDTPKVLGELEIPGFSQYVHPLDATHLITVGQSGKGGIQLQLFDVSDPANLPLPRTFDFGAGSSSEVSYNHKAFTSFEDLLALPVYGQYFSTSQRYSYNSTLEVLRVSAQNGFSELAKLDHAQLYADNGAGVKCGSCEPLPSGGVSCYDYACGYQPELRRGHFVKGEDGQVYVYSISWAGVLVHALPTQTPVAQVGLPQPVFDSQPWYGDDAVQDGGVTTKDAGIKLP